MSWITEIVRVAERIASAELDAKCPDDLAPPLRFPTVSEVIADLEHGLGVRLLDRSSKGVEPTRFGHALLKRTLIVFDELKQSIKDIEHLADDNG
jgi:hypothetical protein